MPKISGRDVLSEATEKAQARLLLVASVAIVSKAYGLPVEDIRLLGMEFPAAIFDVSMLLLVLWISYSYLVKWSGDLMSFRLWYSESSIWSEFGTNMKLDKSFISEGIAALKAFNELEISRLGEEGLRNLSDDKKRLYEEFKLNADLWALRLDHAGKKFKAISAFGHFYVWVQGFALPIGVATVAVYLLIKYGTFAEPTQL